MTDPTVSALWAPNARRHPVVLIFSEVLALGSIACSVELQVSNRR